VSAELINLRRVRKAKARSTAEKEAAENRRRFGLSKSDRALGAAEKALADRNFEAHRRERVQCPDDVDER
jgi:Domain of unknown function (DUF4169)